MGAGASAGVLIASAVVGAAAKTGTSVRSGRFQKKQERRRQDAIDLQTKEIRELNKIRVAERSLAFADALGTQRAALTGSVVGGGTSEALQRNLEIDLRLDELRANVGTTGALAALKIQLEQSELLQGEITKQAGFESGGAILSSIATIAKTGAEVSDS